jgi:hypothetical protein
MTNDTLRSQIARDLRPVRPLAPPLQRTLAVVPFALLLLMAAPFVFSFRDLAPLGFAWSWGASLAQVIVGLAIIAIALQHAVPGREWPPRALAVAIIAVAVLFTVVTFGSWAASPVGLSRGWWTISVVCAMSSAITALPVVVLAAALVNRAYPLHPLATGAIAGFGAGLMADAGWRLFCHYSEPAHVLTAHFGGVLLAAAIGAMLVRLLWRRTH